jgi:hypothetical protein
VKTLMIRTPMNIGVLVMLMSVVLMGGVTGPVPALAEPVHGGRDNCWMTGGGSIFDVEYGGRVTHGFVVHCVPRNSDNLQIVDHVTGQTFHLETLTSAICQDDPAIDPNPPDATFDTFTGEGTGRCKQPDRACTVTFTFTDGGERGGCVRDTALITVREANGDIVFSVSGDVDCGNHQAHSQ